VALPPRCFRVPIGSMGLSAFAASVGFRNRHQAPQVNHDNDVSRQDRGGPAARFQDGGQPA
jgi:hypothetical protein